MPIYEYQGQQYDIPDTDPAIAKEKILGYLSKQQQQPQDQPVQESTEAPAKPQQPEKNFLEEGFLGRIATAGAQAVARIGMDETTKAFLDKQDQLAAEEEKKNTPEMGVGESLVAMGKGIVEHPLEAAGQVVKGLIADPYLLHPALWEALPEAMAARMLKAGLITRAAVAGARGAAIGATAEAGTQAVEGKYDANAIANTATVFGIMSAGAPVIGAGAKKVAGKLPKKETPPINEQGTIEEATQGKEPGTPTELDQAKELAAKARMAVLAEESKISQTAFRNTETGEIIPSGPKHDEAMKAEGVIKEDKQAELNKQAEIAAAEEKARIWEASHKVADEGDKGWIQETIDNVRTKIENLKNTPVEDFKDPPEFANYIQPKRTFSHGDYLTPIDTFKMLKGTDNLGDGLLKLRQSGEINKGQAHIIDLLMKNEFIKTAKLVVDDTDALASTHPDAQGWYEHTDHKVVLSNFGEAVSRNNDIVRTFIHEAIHAATARLVESGHGDTYNSLMNLYGQVKAHYEGKGLDSTAVYGLKNEHEFLAEAFSNPKFQRILSTIPSLENPQISLWKQFKTMISRQLGLSKTAARTALDDALDHGANLMEGTKPEHMETSNKIWNLYREYRKVETAYNEAVDTLGYGAQKTHDLSEELKNIAREWRAAKDELGNKLDDKTFENIQVAEAMHKAEQEARVQQPKYEQGFLTKGGTFVDRKTALQLARETGQIHEKMPLQKPEDGLHSGDLTTAGDKAFQDRNPNITSHGEALKAADDFKKANNEKLDEITKRLYNKSEKLAAALEKDFQESGNTLEAAKNVIGNLLKSAQILGRRAKLQKEAIQEAVPEVALREKITRHLEGEKTTDSLLTDAERLKTVNELTEVLKKWEKNPPPAKGKNSPEERIRNLEYVRDKLRDGPSQEPALAVAEKVKARLKEIGEQAQAQGLMEHLRDNYVPHVIDFSKTKLNGNEVKSLLERLFSGKEGRKLNRNFAAQRVYPFLRDLEEALQGTGIIVKKDIGDILEAYENSMLMAMEHDKMIKFLSGSVSPTGKGYLLPIGAEAQKLGYVSFQGSNAKPLKGLMVHPDIVDTMKFVFNQEDPSLILRSLGAVSHLTKSLNTVASLFHATSLAVAGGTVHPGILLREIFTKGSGIRAAKQAFQHGGDAAMEQHIEEFIKAGLMLTTEDIKPTVIAATGKTVDQLISRFLPGDMQANVLQRVTNPLDKHLIQHLNSFTWDYMHAGQKLNLAIQLFSKAKAKNPEIADAVLRKEIASHINNTFGGLNWLDVARSVENKYASAFAMKALNMQGRDWSQIMLFAPDWTISTLRSFTTALPREIMKPQNWDLRKGVQGIWNPRTQGDFARRYVLNTAIAYLTIQNGINMAMSGHPIWENEDPTRVDAGDGTTIQVAKHSMETAEWVRDPMKTLGNKLGFWPKAVYIEVSGHAYPSINAPKVKPMWKGYGGMEAAKAKAITLLGSPFAISSAVQAPEGEKLKRGVMSSLGIPKYGMTHEQRAEAIAKGRAEKKAEREATKYDTKD